MRIILISLLYILSISCTSSNQTKKKEELAVIATVYNHIPKILPPPPPPTSNSEVKEVNNLDYSKLKHLIFTYAINENFVHFNFDYINGVSNIFDTYKSKKLFEKEIIDASYMKLIPGLSNSKNLETIDKTQLSKLLNEDLLFWDKQIISIQEKINKNLSGIISFSKVSFNNEQTKAAVVVGKYFERNGSGISLYILEKKDSIWIIKYRKKLEMS